MSYVMESQYFEVFFKKKFLKYWYYVKERENKILKLGYRQSRMCMKLQEILKLRGSR